MFGNGQSHQIAVVRRRPDAAGASAKDMHVRFGPLIVLLLSAAAEARYTLDVEGRG